MEFKIHIYIMSIYKITGGDLCYIGSTTQKINERFSKHKDNYRVWKKGGKMGHCSSFDIFDTVGVENCVIELLEQTETLKERERFYMESMVCVNKRIPNRGKKEYRELHKEYFTNYNKEWRQNINKEKNICECGGRYTHTNKLKHIISKKHINFTPCPQPLTQNNLPNPSETSSLPDSPSLLVETHD